MTTPPDDEMTAVAAALADAVRKGGTYLAQDPKRVRGTVSDLLGPKGRQHRAEVDAVVLAAEDGAPDLLLADPSSAAALAARLHDRGLDDTMATYAIASWQFALGHLPTAPTGPPAATDSPTKPATAPLETPEQRPRPSGGSVTGSAGSAAAPVGATVLPADPTRPNGTKRPILVAAAAIAVLVLGGTAIAAFTMASGGGNDIETADNTNDETEQAATRAPRPVPQPTAEELAASDISGEWDVTATTTTCSFLNGCDDPDPGLRAPIFIEGAVVTCSTETACTIAITSGFDDTATTTTAEMVSDGGSRTGSGTLTDPDSWLCDHPDGTFEFIETMQMAVNLAPGAATPTDDDWRASRLVGTLSLTAPGAPGGCAQAAVSYDLSMIRPGEPLPDDVFDAVAAQAVVVLESSTGLDCALLDAQNGILRLSPLPTDIDVDVFSPLQAQRYTELHVAWLRALADAAPEQLGSESETVRELAADLEREGARVGFDRDWTESMFDGSSGEQDAAMRALYAELPGYEGCADSESDWYSFG